MTFGIDHNRRVDSLRPGDIFNDVHSFDQIRVESTETLRSTTHLRGQVVRTGQTVERHLDAHVKVAVYKFSE